MAPNPREEGLGRRAGSLNAFDALLIPRDPRGIVLACGFIGLVALGANAAVGGDPIGFAYVLAAAVGYFFLQTRVLPALVWLLVGAVGVFGATAGQSSDWVVVGLVGLLLVVSILKPASAGEVETSSNLEVPPTRPELELAAPEQAMLETSRNLEVAGRDGLGDVSSNGHDAADAPMPARGARASAKLQTIGRLAIEVDGRDRTQRLRDQPRLEYLLSYLVASAVGAPDVGVDRSFLATEIAPDVPLKSQRERLRKTLNAFNTAVGADLRGLVSATNADVRLDLAGVDADFTALRRMAARVGRRRGLIDTSLAEEVGRLLEATGAGEFLTGFEHLQHEVTEERGGAREVIDQARATIAGWRADLTAALANYFDASGRPQSSIAYLRAALAESQREDLARLLVSAYLQTGQSARADEVRLDYQLN